MHFDTAATAVLTILFFSTLIRAVFGFGNALIAMPLLAMASIGMKTAAPLVALIASVQAFLMIVNDWRIIDMKSTWRLLASSIPGIPLGLLLLKGPYESAGKIILALIIIGFSCYCLFRPRLIELRREWTAYPFGFVAGILGGAYNSNGPPIVIYGTARKWPPDRFRANLQGYFFPAGLIINMSHGLGGLWTPTVGWYLLLSLPVVLLSMWVGNRLHRLIPPGHFARYVHFLMILIGLMLFIQTVTA
jgi:uncharacterized protein